MVIGFDNPRVPTVYYSLFTDYTYLVAKTYEDGRTDTEPIFCHS
jgi:hypothetical protein